MNLSDVTSLAEMARIVATAVILAIVIWVIRHRVARGRSGK